MMIVKSIVQTADEAPVFVVKQGKSLNSNMSKMTSQNKHITLSFSYQQSFYHRTHRNLHFRSDNRALLQFNIQIWF